MRAMFDQKQFAERLRVTIARLGIDQKAAAKQIGVAESTVSRVSRGIGSAPNLENYLRLERWITKHEGKAA